MELPGAKPHTSCGLLGHADASQLTQADQHGVANADQGAPQRRDSLINSGDESGELYLDLRAWGSCSGAGCPAQAVASVA